MSAAIADVPAPRADTELYLRTGPFTTHLRTSIQELAEDIEFLYAGHPRAASAAFADFHIALDRPRGPRAWYKPQVRFSVDGVAHFRPLPIEQSLPMFEWGLNWCIATHANQFLILHAAIIAKNGYAAIMPGGPGAGKSTLTAGLIHRGWRLLSDELALVPLTEPGQVLGLARPLSLKNESVQVIRSFAPEAKLSRVVPGTIKGSVALLRAPDASIAQVAQPARPAWIIFPRYYGGLPALLERRPKAEAMVEIAKQAFNYSVHGARGFELLSDIVDACACYKFTYADLDEAVEIFDRLAPPS